MLLNKSFWREDIYVSYWIVIIRTTCVPTNYYVFFLQESAWAALLFDDIGSVGLLWWEKEGVWRHPFSTSMELRVVTSTIITLFWDLDPVIE